MHTGDLRVFSTEKQVSRNASYTQVAQVVQGTVGLTGSALTCDPPPPAAPAALDEVCLFPQQCPHMRPRYVSGMCTGVCMRDMLCV